MSRRSRHARSNVMLGMTYVAAIVATLPLLFIIFLLLRQGAAYLRPAFFTEMFGTRSRYLEAYELLTGERW